MNYIFGPVSSRRLGQSLGVDPIPAKTCTWNCVYCQLGKTPSYKLERKEYVPTDELIKELKHTLDLHKPGDIDWITFVGSGEPTLHSKIGEMISRTKAMTSIPVAVITNGSLLYMPEVRKALSFADAVLPTLNAGNETLYKKINRPHTSLTFQHLIEGLKAFRKEFNGKLWIEVMLIKGMNDSAEALRELAAVLKTIQPDAVHLILPSRPPTESWVSVPDQDGIMRAQAILSGIAELVNPSESHFELHDPKNPVQEILSVLNRHPMMHSEMMQALKKLDKSNDDIEHVFLDLESSGQARQIEQHGVKFWVKSNH